MTATSARRALMTCAVTGVVAVALLVVAPSSSAATRPTISKLVVKSGTTAGGTRVTVVGKRFRHVKSVRFGGIRGTRVKVVSSRKLRVTAPAHAAGTVHVRVRTRAGKSAFRAADRFTYVAPRPPTPPPPAPMLRISQTPDAAAALAIRLFGTESVRQITVPSSCEIHPKVACPSGSPASPPLTVGLDDRAGDGDSPRAEGVVNDPNGFDITGRIRLTTDEDIPVEVSAGVECGASIDTAAGTSPDVTVDLHVSVPVDASTGLATAGPTQVGETVLSGLEDDDVALNGGIGCSTVSLTLAFYEDLLTRTISEGLGPVGTLCAAPAPGYFQGCA